jgi:hypothetical protein
MTDKKYVIRKFIFAPSLKEALRKEPKTPVDEVFIDESSKDDEKREVDCIGFKMIDLDFPDEY